MNKIFVRETDGLKENILRLANEIESRMEIGRASCRERV